MKMMQNIFNCIGGSQCICELIDKILDVIFKKENVNENIVKILKISFSILGQLC